MIEVDNKLFLSLLMFGPMLSVLFSAGQILKRERQLSVYYSMAHLTMGLWLFQSLAYSTNIFGSSSPYICMVLLPPAFLAPFFQRFRYTWVVKSKPLSAVFWKYWKLPCIIVTLYIMYPFLCRNWTTEVSFMNFRPLFSGYIKEIPFYYAGLHILYPLPKIISLLSLANLMSTLLKYRFSGRDDLPLKSLRISILVISMIITATVLVLAGDLFSFHFCIAGVLLANITLCVIFSVTQRYPALRNLIIYEMEKIKYRNSKIDRLNLSHILQRLYEIMEVEKAFADEDLNMKRVAAELNISQQQLSEILNEKIGKNFKTFVNEFRIEESCTLLKNEPGRSISSIACAVGFNSNTTFTQVFSKITGMTPSVYRRIYR